MLKERRPAGSWIWLSAVPSPQCTTTRKASVGLSGSKKVPVNVAVCPKVIGFGSTDRLVMLGGRLAVHATVYMSRPLVPSGLSPVLLESSAQVRQKTPLTNV